jgi:flagellar capping protein FliD
MESLISGLNAQSSYLSQQMTAITNMMSGNKQ